MSDKDPTGPIIAAGAGEALAGKARTPWLRMALLAVAAGAFIAFGGIGFLIAQATTGTIEGPAQILSGLVFSAGLLLVLVTGAELFTGNTMMALPAAQHRLSGGRMLVAWAVVWIGNLGGSVLIAWLFVAAGGPAGMDGRIAAVAVEVAQGKVDKAPVAILASGVLANMLVCLAVWMGMSARTLPARAIAVIGPVTIFVAAGLEHSVANMSLLAIGWATADPGAIGVGPMLVNLGLSTVGNIAGGILVALTLGAAHDAIEDGG